MDEQIIPRQPVDRCDPDPKLGLGHEQAAQRLARGWGNRASHRTTQTDADIIRDHCLTFFNLVFVVMAVLMRLVGSSVLNLTFMVVVIVNTVIGCFQQIRAKRAVERLTLVAEQTLPVIREGQTRKLPSHMLVLDDIVVFAPGDQICADGILRTGQLQVNEALVTGEADAIVKNPGDHLLSGSFVIAGRGRAQLTAVGDDAFAARLAAEAKQDPRATKSEMMASLDKLIKVIGIILLPVGLLLFFNQLQTTDLRSGVEATVAALVGMIPEGLYLLTSVALAVAALKLTRRRVLVQDMNCIEALARADVLCVDKTGTITEPVMELEQIIPLTQDPPEELEAILTALYGSGEPDNDTGRALQELFRGMSDWVCTKRIPFTSQTKWNAGVFDGKGAFLTGAPEVILGNHFDSALSQAEGWSGAGYRVLLVARYDGDPEPDKLEPDRVSPLALLALTNRIRPNAPETFRYFAKQGVCIKVISGDNPATVSDVARRAGIDGAERFVDANTLHTREDFFRAAEEYTVFGRVTPDQKKQLILAMKAQGHTVAMTGDGVNDVLAMKDSHCGIAMASGAQAASQVARLVLLDSDFSAMPAIVDEGRRVIGNIRRAASLFLVKNIFSLGLALVTLLTSLRFPLESFHLSIVSALTIGIPGFFLAMEPNYPRVRGQFLSTALRNALPGGLTNILVVLTAQAFMAAFQLPETDGQTISTAILCTVGLLVLHKVCQPFTKLRRWIWGGATAAVIGAFVLLPPAIGYLQITQASSWLVMLAVLVMTPTVFFALNRIFDLTDRFLEKRKARK